MSQCKFGLWLDQEGQPRRPRNFIQKVQPTTALVISSVGTAYELKQLSPQTDVAYRFYHSHEQHWRGWSAQDWVNKYEQLIAQNGGERIRRSIRFTVLNEPVPEVDWNHEPGRWLKSMKDLSNMLVEIIEKTAQRQIMTSVMQAACASIPYVAMFEEGCMDDVIYALDANREYAVFSDHMYGIHPQVDLASARRNVPGWPNGLTPNVVFDLEAMRPQYWPTASDILTYWQSNYTLFRMGVWLNKRAEQLGITEPLKIRVDECWADRMPHLDSPPWDLYDRIREHYNILPRPPAIVFRGIRSYYPFYKAVHPYWQPGETAFYIMKHLAEIAPVYYMGFVPFAWDEGDEEWDIKTGMNISRLDEGEQDYLPLWIGWAQSLQRQEVEPVYPKPTPFPENLGEPEQYVLVAADGFDTVNGRAGTTLEHEIILEIPSGSIVKVWRETAVMSANRLWYLAEYNGRRLWIPQTGFNADGTLRNFDLQFLPLPIKPEETKPPAEEKPQDTPPAEEQPADESPAEETSTKPDIEHERLQVLRDLTAALNRLAMALEQRPLTATR